VKQHRIEHASGGEGIHTSLKAIPGAALAQSGFENPAPNSGKNIKSSK
jgi:hypothetical protein